MPIAKPELISLHGGHSGVFCSHAEGTLEETVRAYIERGFRRVGITEHMPPVSDRYLFPEEIAAGLDAAAVYRRFARYMMVGRELRKKYASSLTIYLGFETESFSGYRMAVRGLVKTFRPDYIVGSVHHVGEIPFDYSPERYGEAAVRAGGLDGLYCRYFDLQFEMINALRPAVVGHLDLIRIFDPDYRGRLGRPAIGSRLRRNLDRIGELGLILDCDCRELPEGGEPYPCRPILEAAREKGIDVVPGDDSHCAATAGQGIKEGIALLEELGFDTGWRSPVALHIEQG
ncbi:MAG: histidinol-phosphatase [PVC group bacterium]